MESKIVHSEMCSGLLLEISAKYRDDHSIKVNGKWYDGRVILYCKIFDDGELIINFNSAMGSLHQNSLYYIAYGRKHERYGFLKLKKKTHLIHISEVYDKVYPSFLEYCRSKASAMARTIQRERNEQEIVDGLPDSLKAL